MTAPQEPLWKRWLDRLLMLNLLAVLLGAGFFGLAVLAQLQGHSSSALVQACELAVDQLQASP